MHSRVRSMIAAMLVSLAVLACLSCTGSPTQPPPPPSSITTSTQPGKLSFWTGCSTCGEITVAVQGNTVGTILQYFTSKPVCGQNGTITVTEAPGTYAYTAHNSAGLNWSSSATSSNGSCTLVQLLAPATGTGSGTSGGGSSGGTNGTYTTPVPSSCVSIYADPAYYNWLSIKNVCSAAIEITYFRKSDPQGGYEANDVKPGQSVNTGFSSSESGGGFYVYLCPAGYLAVDSNGNALTRAIATYYCKYEPFLPR